MKLSGKLAINNCMSIQLLKTVVGPLRTNTYVLYHQTRGKGIIIDPGDEGEKILSAISGIAIYNILLTHGHPDHLGAAKTLKAATLASLQMHSADAHLLLRYQGIEPDRVLSDGEIIQFPDLKTSDGLPIEQLLVLEVMATPGHSAGSLCYYDRNNQRLFCGDTLQNGRPGTTQYPTGSKEAMEYSLSRLIGLPPEVRVYPGHGPDFTIDSLRLNNLQAYV